MAIPGVEDRIRALGHSLPQPAPAVGTYVGAVSVGTLVFVSGHGPVRDNQFVYRGKLGQDVDLPFHAFDDLDSNLRVQVERIREHPWIKDVPVHGLVYEVETGALREVV